MNVALLFEQLGQERFDAAMKAMTWTGGKPYGAKRGGGKKRGGKKRRK